MKKVIIDTSALIFAAKASILPILKSLYKKLYITPDIMREIEKPLLLGFDAPEIKLIKDSNIIKTVELTSKELIDVKNIKKKHGIGEAEAAKLFKKGKFDLVIVADKKAERKLKELNVNCIDILDVGYVAAKKGIIDIRKYAKKLFDIHYVTERIAHILGRKRYF